MVVFLGDFNYRLHGISYDEARDFISQRCFDWLRERDQLRAEMKAGKVFQGMREGHIRFPPTYKFDRHQVGLAGILHVVSALFSAGFFQQADCDIYIYIYIHRERASARGRLS